MKIHGLTTITGLTAALVFSAPVLAEAEQASGKVDNPTQRWETFENLDQNKDGELTYSEAREEEALSEEWDTYDKDESGSLDRAEFSAFEEEHQGDTDVESQSGETDVENQSGKVDNPTQRWQEMGEKDPTRMAE